MIAKFILVGLLVAAVATAPAEPLHMAQIIRQTQIPPPGPAPLGTASYNIPAGAIWISPTGSDANSGLSSAAPKQTLAAAIDTAPSAGTIVMRAGTYRPSAIWTNKTLAIINEPGAVVTWDGSIAISDTISGMWESNLNSTNPLLTGGSGTTGAWALDSGSVYRKSGIVLNFDHTVVHAATLPAYPTAGWPESVFVGGVPYVQQTSKTNVNGPNKFFYDTAARTLYIHGDPAGHLVEVGVVQKAIVLAGSNSQLKGIRVRRYTTSCNQYGAISVTGAGTLIENCWFVDHSLEAVFVNGVAATIKNNMFDRCGKAGGTGFRADGTSLLYNIIKRNNSRQFDGSAEAGGWKFSSSRNLVVTGNLVDDNLGHGLWLDIFCDNAVINRNICRRNQGYWAGGGPDGAGIHFEISRKAAIIGNICTNQSHGILIGTSTEASVYNNICIDNRNASIAANDSGRTDAIIPDGPGAGTRIIGDTCTVRNNILSSYDYQTGPMQVIDDITKTKTWSQMHWSSDYNAYYRKSAAKTPNVAVLANGTAKIKCATVPSITSQTGQDSHSVTASALDSDPYVTNAAAGNYAPLSQMPEGESMPSLEFASWLGLVSGTAARMGAIQTDGTSTAGANWSLY